MHTYYGDILKSIEHEPQWFDEHGVPRYCPFSTRAIAFIYAREAALVLIRCQGCGREFHVAFSEINVSRALLSEEQSKLQRISDLIEHGCLHYGDPPNTECCDAGPTMNSIPVRVLQYWYKPTVRGAGLSPDGKRIVDLSALNFRRDPAFERELGRH